MAFERCHFRVSFHKRPCLCLRGETEERVNWIHSEGFHDPLEVESRKQLNSIQEPYLALVRRLTAFRHWSNKRFIL